MKRRVQRAPEVIWDVVDGTTVVCHTGSGAFFEFNATASVVWSLCDHIEIDELVGKLQESYPSERADDLAKDVEAFVAYLEGSQLVQVHLAVD